MESGFTRRLAVLLAWFSLVPRHYLRTPQWLALNSTQVSQRWYHGPQGQIILSWGHPITLQDVYHHPWSLTTRSQGYPHNTTHGTWHCVSGHWCPRVGEGKPTPSREPRQYTHLFSASSFFVMPHWVIYAGCQGMCANKHPIKGSWKYKVLRKQCCCTRSNRLSFKRTHTARWGLRIPFSHTTCSGPQEWGEWPSPKLSSPRTPPRELTTLCNCSVNNSPFSASEPNWS